jgi:hypothetical protein
MPRKLRSPKARARRPDISPAIRVLLETGALPETREDGVSWWDAFVKLGHPDLLREDWEYARDEILADWTTRQPGRRPHAWWLFDAPRARREDLAGRARDAGDWLLLRLAQPRRRVGGVGTAAHEVLNYMPAFERGIPTNWVSAFDEACYNGRALDIHGKPIEGSYPGGHFPGLAPRPDDPPTFESEAAYLKRHHLLTEAERRVLTDEDFAPEPLTFDEEDEDVSHAS